METDPPKNEKKDESENESEENSEEKSDKKSDMETNNNIVINSNNILEKSGNSIDEDDKDIEPFSEKCDLLKMITVPTFGKYSNDYSFLEQILILKSKSKFENIPEFVKKKIGKFAKKISKYKS